MKHVLETKDIAGSPNFQLTTFTSKK